MTRNWSCRLFRGDIYHAPTPKAIRRLSEKAAQQKYRITHECHRDLLCRDSSPSINIQSVDWGISSTLTNRIDTSQSVLQLFQWAFSSLVHDIILSQFVYRYCRIWAAGRSFMAAANEPPMTSPSSSNSTGQEPQLPPLLPPLRSTQHILQQLSVFPGANISLSSFLLSVALLVASLTCLHCISYRHWTLDTRADAEPSRTRSVIRLVSVPVLNVQCSTENFLLAPHVPAWCSSIDSEWVVYIRDILLYFSFAEMFNEYVWSR